MDTSAGRPPDPTETDLNIYDLKSLCKNTFPFPSDGDLVRGIATEISGGSQCGGWHLHLIDLTQLLYSVADYGCPLFRIGLLTGAP